MCLSGKLKLILRKSWGSSNWYFRSLKAQFAHVILKHTFLPASGTDWGVQTLLRPEWSLTRDTHGIWPQRSSSPPAADMNKCGNVETGTSEISPFQTWISINLTVSERVGFICEWESHRLYNKSCNSHFTRLDVAASVSTQQSTAKSELHLVTLMGRHTQDHSV